MTQLTHVDHVQIGVSDLDAAVDGFGAFLGRQPSWRGSHPAQGTSNCLFRIDNTYLELIAGGRFLATRIENEGEGVTGLFFGCSDIDAYVARAARHVQGIAAREGRGEDAAGNERRWRSAHIMTRQNRGNFHAAIQHTTDPGVLAFARPIVDGHVNRLTELHVSSADLGATQTLYNEILQLDRESHGTYQIGETRLLVYPDVHQYHRDRIHTLVFAASDPSSLRARIEGSTVICGVRLMAA